QGNLGVRGLIAEGLGGPGADQFTSLEVVGGKGGIGRIDRLQRRVECDHQHACIAGLLDDRHERLGVGGGDQDALGTGGNAGLDGLNLGLVVSVDLAGVGLQLDAELLGLGGGAFLHLDEERVDVGLGDKAGGD